MVNVSGRPAAAESELGSGVVVVDDDGPAPRDDEGVAGATQEPGDEGRVVGGGRLPMVAAPASAALPSSWHAQPMRGEPLPGQPCGCGDHARVAIVAEVLGRHVLGLGGVQMLDLGQGDVVGLRGGSVVMFDRRIGRGGR